MNFQAQNAIGTYSVILTMNPKVVNKLIGSPFIHSLDELATSKDTLFYTSKDSNFLEFTNEFAYGDTPDAGKETLVTLKVQDEGLNFLKRFHYEGLSKTLQVFKNAKFKAAARELNPLVARAERLEDIIANNITVIENEQAKVDEFRADESWYDDEDPTQVIERRIEKRKKKIKESEDELQSIWAKIAILKDKMGDKGFPKVYIAYGTGNNYKDWAGPIECYLGDIQYDNAGRKEVTTYKFLVNVLTASYNSVNAGFSHKTHRRNTLLGWSAPVALYKKLEAGAGADTATKVMYTTNPTWQRITYESFSYSLHDCIIRLISGYLYKNGIENNLIVMPDLDILLKPFFQSILESFVRENPGINLKSSDKVFNDDGTLTDVAKEKGAGMFSPYFLSLVKSSGGSTFGSFDQFNPMANLFPEQLKTIGPSGSSPASNDIVLFQHIMTSFFSRLGIHVAKLEDKTMSADPAIPVTSVVPDPGAGAFMAGEPIPDVCAVGTYAIMTDANRKQDIVDPFTGDIIKDVGIGWILQFPWFDEKHIPGDQLGGVDILAPIRNLFKSIEQSSGESLIDFEGFWENNSIIKNKIIKKFGGGTYYGYTKRWGGPRGGGTDAPFLVIGDAELIRLMLYGEADFDPGGSRTDPSSRRSTLTHPGAGDAPESFWVALENIGVPIGVEFQKVLRDRFWTEIMDDLNYERAGLYTALRYSPTLALSMARRYGGGALSPVPGTVGPPRITQASPYLFAATRGSAMRGHFFLHSDYWSDKSWFADIFETMMAKLRHSGFFDAQHSFLDPDNESDLRRADVVKNILPDEFASQPDAVFWATRIAQLGTPIFKANVRNSNVLSYKLDASKWMMAQFFGVFEEVYFNQFQKFIAGTSPDPITMSTSDIRDKILVIMNKYTTTRSMTMPSLSWAITPSINADIMEIANDLTDLLSLESAGSYTATDAGAAGAALNFVVLFKALFDSVFIGTIKTVPMFHLSYAHIHTKPCVVFLKSTRRVTPIKRYTGTYNSSDFFSGVYRILGYKHTISAKKAHSEFLVHRDIVGDIEL